MFCSSIVGNFVHVSRKYWKFWLWIIISSITLNYGRVLKFITIFFFKSIVYALVMLKKSCAKHTVKFDLKITNINLAWILYIKINHSRLIKAYSFVRYTLNYNIFGKSLFKAFASLRFKYWKSCTSIYLKFICIWGISDVIKVF